MRFKMSVAMVAVFCIQVTLFVVYVLSQSEIIFREQINLVPVEVNTLYTLYALEFVIMSSVLYARSIQHEGENQAQ